MIQAVAGAVRGLGGIAGKETAEKVAKRSITPQNARAEIQSFVSDYSVENLQQLKDKKSGNYEHVENALDQVADDLKLIASPENQNAQVKITDEVITQAKETAEEVSKPKSRSKFEKGDLSFIKDKIGNLPTPAGIGFLLFIILFILFSFQSVATVGGERITRLGLIFRTLLGKTYIGDDDPTKQTLFYRASSEAAETGQEIAEEVKGWMGDLSAWGVDIGTTASSWDDKLMNVMDDIGDWGRFK